jgi:nucleotide-binding universal stress UspA family protein
MSDLKQRQILVAVDGSEAAWSALGVALDLQRALGCNVTAVTAIQTRLPGYRAGYFSFVDRHVLDELRRQAGGVLEEARRRAGPGGVALGTETLEGEADVFEQLADLLERTPDVAFLVLGSYGHRLRDRYLLGSTTQRLILELARRELKVPVVVVP